MRLITRILNKYRKWRHKKATNSSIALRESLNKSICEVNKLLSGSGICEKFNANDFIVPVGRKSKRLILDRGLKLSDVLIKETLPIEPKVIEVYHFSNKDAAQSIIDGRNLRLYSLKKRVKDHEVKEFLRKFDYKYPLGMDPVRKESRYVESICNNTFYISVTDVVLKKDTESHCWANFAKGESGARFKFEFKFTFAPHRKIVYEKSIDRMAAIYKGVKQIFMKNMKREYIWQDAALVCTYYLPMYSVENETRIALRRESCGLTIKKDAQSNHDFVELNFGTNTIFNMNDAMIEITLKEVMSNTKFNNIPAGVTTRLHQLEGI